MNKQPEWKGNAHQQQYDDDFEDFGYKVKNINRLHRNKLAKFKDHIGWRQDTL